MTSPGSNGSAEKTTSKARAEFSTTAISSEDAALRSPASERYTASNRFRASSAAS